MEIKKFYINLYLLSKRLFWNGIHNLLRRGDARGTLLALALY